jgi:hypothetical protein
VLQLFVPSTPPCCQLLVSIIFLAGYLMALCSSPLQVSWRVQLLVSAVEQAAKYWVLMNAAPATVDAAAEQSQAPSCQYAKIHLLWWWWLC